MQIKSKQNIIDYFNDGIKKIYLLELKMRNFYLKKDQIKEQIIIKLDKY